VIDRLGLRRPAHVRALSLTALVVATLLATQGAIVRATDSGLGCPDWPLCHGALTPPQADVKAIIEYTHRVLAAAGGLVILAAAIAALMRSGVRSLAGRVGIAAILLLDAQVLLGAGAVRYELPAWIVTAHLTAATLLIGTMATLAVLAQPRGPDALTASAELRWVTGLTAAAALMSIAAGGYVASSYSGAACPEWPLCGSAILPRDAPTEHPTIHMLHRLVVAVAAYGALHGATRLWRERRRFPRAARLALAGALGMTAQIGVGALNALTAVPPVTTAVHAFLAQWVWVALLATWLDVSVHGGGVAAGSEPRTTPSEPLPRSVQRAIDLFRVTKPRVILELLITTFAAMVLAARGFPSGSVIAATLGGGALCGGAAAAFNSLYDRDIDRIMQRTRGRPLPCDRLDPRLVVGWASSLLALSLLILGFGVSGLAAGLAGTAFAIYVGVYTLGLKRRSAQNIVIGGAAGAIPPLVGWVAGAGALDLSAVILFLIVFVWTPPHFWALALVRRGDYTRAGVPMLPVVRGEPVARRYIMVYSVFLLALTVVLAPVNQLGWIYLVAAVVLGAVFLLRAWALLRAGTSVLAQRLFRYSITYLTVLFTAMVADVLLLR